MQPVHFILDEAAMLSQMSSVDDALGIGRAYGVRLQLFYQSIGQLKKCFPEGQEQTLFSNTSQVFFGVNDNATAEYVSTRLGEETIVVDSGGTSWSDSQNSTYGQQPSESSGNSTTRNHNWSQQARKLLKPEEVMALPQNFAITFTPGVSPVCTKLLRYYQEKRLGQLARGSTNNGRNTLVAIAHVLVIVVLLCVALRVTLAVVEQTQTQPTPHQIPFNRGSLPQGADHVRNSQETLRRTQNGESSRNDGGARPQDTRARIGR